MHHLKVRQQTRNQCRHFQFLTEIDFSKFSLKLQYCGNHTLFLFFLKNVKLHVHADFHACEQISNEATHVIVYEETSHVDG